MPLQRVRRRTRVRAHVGRHPLARICPPRRADTAHRTGSTLPGGADALRAVSIAGDPLAFPHL
ncbi:hypothetical protein, partial [Saccharothrix sp. ST-888]|uniref:hypothetical protein n=1 Tax=Saccharothrix sp. ST-888 TaxID=1427391 RepID=UPI0005EC2FF5